MTAAMMDFLLARIAEDEERAQFVARQIEGNNWAPFEEWKLSWHDEYDLLCIEPSRALAECGARQRLADLHSPQPDEIDVLFCGTCTDRDSPYGVRWPCATFANLAVVYSDHPNYRREWRP